MTRWGYIFGAGCCLLLALLSGCSTPTKTAPKTYTFFPPSPDEPRIQFLTSFSSEADFGSSRKFADFITGERRRISPLGKPYGLAVHDGKIYVCDTKAAEIQVFDLKKNRVSVFAPQGEGGLRLPINISIDEDGTRYVADNGRAQVLIYRADGTFLEAMGKKDEMKPTDVAITADRLYITDLKNHVVKVFSKADHRLLFSIPRNDKTNTGKLYEPTNLAVDKNGRLLVSDIGNYSVQAYDLDGNYLRTIGKQGVAPGLFSRPKGVAVDRQGLVYVVDAATQVVQIFDAEGRLLLFFGEPGASTQGQLILPASVKVDYNDVGYFQKYVAPGCQCEYLILVTSQFGGDKVSVYGFLKKT
jgi:DNA-binding beta-propeller fold protein YncE